MHGTRNGPLGKRHRVACGRLGYTHGMQAARWGKGTGSGMGYGDWARKNM